MYRTSLARQASARAWTRFDGTCQAVERSPPPQPSIFRRNGADLAQCQTVVHDFSRRARRGPCRCLTHRHVGAHPCPIAMPGGVGVRIRRRSGAVRAPGADRTASRGSRRARRPRRAPRRRGAALPRARWRWRPGPRRRRRPPPSSGSAKAAPAEAARGGAGGSPPPRLFGGTRRASSADGRGRPSWRTPSPPRAPRRRRRRLLVSAANNSASIACRKRRRTTKRVRSPSSRASPSHTGAAAVLRGGSAAVQELATPTPPLEASTPASERATTHARFESGATPERLPRGAWRQPLPLLHDRFNAGPRAIHSSLRARSTCSSASRQAAEAARRTRCPQPPSALQGRAHGAARLQPPPRCSAALRARPAPQRRARRHRQRRSRVKSRPQPAQRAVRCPADASRPIRGLWNHAAGGGWPVLKIPSTDGALSRSRDRSTAARLVEPARGRPRPASRQVRAELESQTR